MVPDSTFHNWVIRKKENYEGGADVTSDSLMLDALNRYQSLLREGKWQSITPESKRIIALTSQVSELQKMLKGTNFKLSSRKTNSNKFEKKSSSEKRKVSKQIKKKSNDDDTWKKVPPSEGNPKTKVVKGKEFNWCDEHMAWGRHKPIDCHLKHQRLNNQNAASNNVSNSTIVENEEQSNILAALTSILKE